MKIERKSMFTGRVQALELDVTDQELSSWENGLVAQKAFPRLSAADREFIMTGVTGEEWDSEMGEEE